jgi:glutaredoxin
MRSMKWVLTLGLLAFLLWTPAWTAIGHESDPDVIVFYQEGCNDCRHMDDVLDDLVAIYPELVVVHIEESELGAVDLMWALSAKYGIFPTKFPVIFVGDRAITGVGRDKEMLLESAVRNCALQGCDSPLSRLEKKPIPWMTILMVLTVALFVAVILFA